MRGSLSLAVAVAVVMGAGLIACGSDALKAEDVHDRIQTACSERITQLAAEGRVLAGPSFAIDTAEKSTQLNNIEAYDLIHSLHGPKDQRAQLDELDVALRATERAKYDAVSDLEERVLDKAQSEIDEAAKTGKQVDELAKGLDLPECTSKTWFGDWFYQAQNYHDALVLETKPTGDFMTDVEAACSRLGEDIASAPAPLRPTDTQQWALDISNGLDLFIRDVKALDVPEADQSAVDTLDAAIDDLQDNLSRIVGAIGTGGATATLVTNIQSGIADVLDKIAALGAEC
jgi:hypothetical protein